MENSIEIPIKIGIVKTNIKLTPPPSTGTSKVKIGVKNPKNNINIILTIFLSIFNKTN
ncbi:hypothetical protein GCM10022388_17390 [Flavobacterium chungnamense]|uniref:Uncharacterized protein n=1 Tax=Flavobacterium chungnamense TaxID=706182 RepID=A0ABP7USM0_9FLAO